MIFNIRKGIIPIIHVLFCIIILIVPLVIMSRNGTVEYWHYMGYFIRSGLLIALFYINYFILIDKLLFKKQFVMYIIINLGLILGTVFLQNLLFEIIMGPPPRKDFGQHMPKLPPQEMRILGDYVIIVFAIGMSVALKATMRWYKDSINLETVKAAQLEADLKNLRSQLNPHFLFNTLNNIYSLIAIDTEKAQESVHRLSNLLRYILYENNEKFVPIDRELEFTQNYIDLMRLRLRPDIKIDVLIRNDNCHYEIASLLFITLIENAFKHGINNGAESFINIKIFVDNKKGVLCTIENSLNDSKSTIDSKNSGIGLVNLRKRLELLYPHRHQFVVEEKDDRFSVLLCIDFANEKNIEE